MSAMSRAKRLHEEHRKRGAAEPGAVDTKLTAPPVTHKNN